jgi:hypothetical protein
MLIVCCLIIALLIVFRKTTFVKKYWQYSLILIPAIIILLLKIISVIRQPNVVVEQQKTPVQDHIAEIKGKLEEVNAVVKIEAVVAKEKNDVKLQELKEVQKIPDDRERRKKLAQMIG